MLPSLPLVAVNDDDYGDENVNANGGCDDDGFERVCNDPRTNLVVSRWIKAMLEMLVIMAM